MDKLTPIPVVGLWGDQVSRINQNIDKIQDGLEDFATSERLFKGFYLTLSDLRRATNKYPYPQEGSYAYVNSSGVFPALKYEYSEGSWVSRGLVDTPENIDIRILLESEELEEGDIKSILLD